MWVCRGRAGAAQVVLCFAHPVVKEDFCCLSGRFGAAVPCEELRVAKGMGTKIYTGEKPSKARLCTS